jgi:hypothetical protein
MVTGGRAPAAKAAASFELVLELRSTICTAMWPPSSACLFGSALQPGDTRGTIAFLDGFLVLVQHVDGRDVWLYPKGRPIGRAWAGLLSEAGIVFQLTARERWRCP